MKATTKSLLAAALVSAAFTLGAQTPAPAAQPAPAAKPAAAQPAPEKKMTADEFLAFLPDTVAEYNGDKLTKNDLKLLFAEAQFPFEQIVKMPNYKEQLRLMVESYMVQRMLLKRAAAAGFPATEAWMQKIMRDEWNALPKDRQEMLLKQIKNLDVFIAEQSKNRLQREKAALNKYFESLVKANAAKVSEADVQKFYDEHKEKEFKVPETVSVSHILVLAAGRDQEGKPLSEADKKKQDEAAQKKIAEVQAKLAKGEDFGELAKQYSDCPSKAEKGALPAFGKGQMVPEFEKAAFALEKPGQVSGIVKTQFGYHIIKLTGKKTASYVPFDDKLKSDIKEIIASQALDKSLRAEVEQIRNSKTIKTYGFPAPAPAPAAQPAPAPAAAK